jgi:PEP-CTERM motif
MKAAYAAAALAAVISFAAPAGAVVVTRTYDFSATNFVAAFGATPSPFATVAGTVTITFDDAANQIAVTSGITLDSFNAALGSPIAFTYVAASNGIFAIGGSAASPQGLNFNTDDFTLQIRDVRTQPFFGSFSFTQVGYTTSWHAGQGSVIVHNSAVPEPGTWAMLLVGFGAVGAALRRPRRRLVRA